MAQQAEGWGDSSPQREGSLIQERQALLLPHTVTESAAPPSPPARPPCLQQSTVRIGAARCARPQSSSCFTGQWPHFTKTTPAISPRRG